MTLHYTLRDGEGRVLESSTGREPMRYLHGKGNILPGLERALAGRKSGERVEVTLAPEQGYGQRDDRLVQVLPRTKFGESASIAPGMQVRADGPRGARILTVVKVERDFVTVDANHPLAGRSLNFSVEIVDVRRATHEEVSHGHVHGPGGHHP